MHKEHAWLVQVGIIIILFSLGSLISTAFTAAATSSVVSHEHYSLEAYADEGDQKSSMQLRLDVECVCLVCHVLSFLIEESRV